MVDGSTGVNGRATTLGRTWRVTTAARVFVISLALGQSLSLDRLQSAGTTLVALATLAAVTCAVEFDPPPRLARWTPVAEGVLAVVLISTVGALIPPLLVYVTVPPVVAGVRHGAVTAMNTALAMGLALVATAVTARSVGTTPPSLASSLPWLILGLGAGLLAAWQTRSVRSLEESQGPYVEAHRLLTQLRNVSINLADGLESQSVAQRLVEALACRPEVGQVTVVASSAERPLAPIAESLGAATPSHVTMRAAQDCMVDARPLQTGDATALPLRVGDHTFGAVLVSTNEAWNERALADLQLIVDEHALKLDTACLFDDLRAVATTEERHRLAREIHDGVAQEIAALGYSLDDLATASKDPVTQDLAIRLRKEVTRVVRELRLSIFDLRHGLGEGTSLTAALTEYVQRVSAEAGIRAHMLLDEKRDTLHPNTSEELLRIGQEAVTNVRKHAHARNLWVTLAIDGMHAVLKVEDDGIGAVSARDRHYGLHTMQERATRINADFCVTRRANGGTIVTVETRLPQADPGALEGVQHGDRRIAR